jgi:hypothetical protein
MKNPAYRPAKGKPCDLQGFPIITLQMKPVRMHHRCITSFLTRERETLQPRPQSVANGLVERKFSYWQRCDR